MRRPVDAVRATADHRHPPVGEAEREVGGDVLAVRAGGPRAHDRDGALDHLRERSRPPHEQRQRRRRQLAAGPPPGEPLLRPLVVAGARQASAAPGQPAGVVVGAAALRAQARGLHERRRQPPDGDAAAQRGYHLDRAVLRDGVVHRPRPGLDEAGQGEPRPPLRVVRAGHAAGPARPSSRYISAMATWPAPGCSSPCRSARVQASGRTALLRKTRPWRKP